MAVVRFSEKLKGEILSNARDMFQKRLRDHDESLVCDHGDKMYEQVFGEWKEMMNQLPDNFLPVEDGFRITAIWGKDSEGTVVKLPFRHTKTFKFSKSRRVPEKILDASRGRLKEGNWRSELQYVCNMDDPEDAQFFQMVHDWYQQGRDMRMAANEFINGVTKVMNSFTTLKPALKAWPPLWDLVPEWAKERHREVRKREKRDPAEELDVDLNKMTGVVIGNKLTGDN